jgi:hypothetical protein
LSVVLPKSSVILSDLRAKGLNAKDINKKNVPVYGGKCLSCEAVHSWVEELSQERSKVADDARPGTEMAETTVKKLLRYWFRRTAKAMGQVYQCWWRICREINDSSKFEYYVFYVLYPFVAYLLTLSPTYHARNNIAEVTGHVT